jgi:hypothetical protein
MESPVDTLLTCFYVIHDIGDINTLCQKQQMVGLKIQEIAGHVLFLQYDTDDLSGSVMPGNLIS